MTNQCFVCERPISPLAEYCRRCLRHLPHRHRAAYSMALKAAWNPILQVFICFYTGLILEENDRSNPWYLSYDHRIPQDINTLVVCARWVNSMKTSLSDDEFKAVDIELDRSHKAKEPFNMAVCEFKYWKGPADQKPKKKETADISRNAEHRRMHSMPPEAKPAFFILRGLPGNRQKRSELHRTCPTTSKCMGRKTAVLHMLPDRPGSRAPRPEKPAVHNIRTPDTEATPKSGCRRGIR